MVRNLAEYPITKEDKIKALEWGIKAYRESGLIGGVVAVALQALKNELEEAPEMDGE